MCTKKGQIYHQQTNTPQSFWRLEKRTWIKLQVEIRLHCTAEIFITANYNTGIQSNNRQHESTTLCTASGIFSVFSKILREIHTAADKSRRDTDTDSSESRKSSSIASCCLTRRVHHCRDTQSGWISFDNLTSLIGMKRIPYILKTKSVKLQRNGSWNWTQMLSSLTDVPT